ncbi:hypothetical protein B0I37DRAFT_410330 [Chaetomium sp. MPI-CAGE-AT-0009]|nr:hypothetical protein B0I37DRAFT_410330 [Chaetomium sp. MPI-CAGE-AT-0009]
MANNPLPEPLPELPLETNGSESIPSGPFDGSQGTAGDLVWQVERRIAAVTRFWSHLVDAIAMARMTVFAVGHNGKITMMAGARSLAQPASHHASNNSTSYIGENGDYVYDVLGRLLWTPGEAPILPFSECLEPVAHQLQTQLANTPSTSVHNTSDLHSVRTSNIQFSVTNVIKETFGTLRPLAESKGLLLRTDIADDFKNGFEVMGNPGHLQQLLSSLLKNSIKTTRLGFVWASVVKERDDLESATVKFVITDTGRIRETSPSGALGTTEGSCIHHELGLCKAMVEAMKGRMSLDSIAETGTTTTILIPFNLPAGRQTMIGADKTYPRPNTPPYDPFL